MESVWVLDYLQMLHIKAGFFHCETAALEWVDQNDPHRKDFYTPIEIAPAKPDGLTGMQYRYRYAYQS